MKSAKTSGRRRGSATFTDFFFFFFSLSIAGVKSKKNSKTYMGSTKEERERERERERKAVLLRERERERRHERGRHFCCVLPHGQVFQRTQWNFPRLLHSRIFIIIYLFIFPILWCS